MDEKKIRQLVAERAKAYLNCREKDSEHQKLLASYNGIKPLPRGYRVGEEDAWCGVFVSALGAQIGISHILLPECGCGEMLALYKKQGRWQTGEGFLPQVGDVVFYNWNGGKGNPQHVGIVEKVEGETLTVIEGNYKNAVGRRTVSAFDSRICGYGLPDYARLAGRVDCVAAVQCYLNLCFDAGLGVDGVYGKKTKRALLCALQKNLRVEETGVYDEKTQSAMKKNNLRKGDRGDLVAILQAFLVCSGYPEAYADGSFGSATQKALKSYQLKNGLLPDGVFGSKTLKKLCI